MWKVKHNDLFHLMIPCGISSTIFGLVYGSLFGYEEALDPLYHAIGMAGKPVSDVYKRQVCRCLHPVQTRKSRRNSADPSKIGRAHV